MVRFLQGSLLLLLFHFMVMGFAVAIAALTRLAGTLAPEEKKGGSDFGRIDTGKR